MSLRTGFLSRGGIMLGDLAVTFGLGPLTYTIEPIPTPLIVVTQYRGPNDLSGDVRNRWTAAVLVREVAEEASSEPAIVIQSLPDRQPEVTVRSVPCSKVRVEAPVITGKYRK